MLHFLNQETVRFRIFVKLKGHMLVSVYPDSQKASDVSTVTHYWKTLYTLPHCPYSVHLRIHAGDQGRSEGSRVLREEGNLSP